jgi:hypothetical protein
VSSPKIIVSAEVMASLWIAPWTGGFAAAFYTTNSNGVLFVLDHDFGTLGQTSLGQGALNQAPSLAALPLGFAALYPASPDSLEFESYDLSGHNIGHRTLATTGPILTGTAETALVSNGTQLFAIYPGAVSGQYTVQALDNSGSLLGKAASLPNCLATASRISAAWGNNRLAVAAVNEAAGVMKSSVCVTLMGCP